MQLEVLCLDRTTKLTALPGAETNRKHTDSMAKKSTSKTRSAPAVDRAALCSSVDVLAAIKWLEQMSTMALADTLMALDAGNLAAAQAHSERMKLAENMVPWLVGPCDTMITARIEYQTNDLHQATASDGRPLT